MKRRENLLPAFLVISFLSLIILILSLSGNLKFLSSFFEKGTSGIQNITFGIFHNLPFVSRDLKIKDLREENLELLSRVADLEKLKKENQALSDQFKVSYPQPSSLLKAKIIGAPSFVPGISAPNSFVLDKGSKDGVKAGQTVVIENNLVGTIKNVSNNLSAVNLITNSSSSFTAKTENGAFGVFKGGSSLTLDNVLLSENIKTSEIVLTKGDMDIDNVGIPGDLVIGKIISVDKNPSDLFQKAEVESFIDFVNLSTVFIYIRQ